MLFLHPTNLPADSAVPRARSWYYVTGVTAGMYRRTPAGHFERVVLDDVDTTPQRVGIDEVRGLR